MATLVHFRSEKCPKCGETSFHRVGDAHYTVTTMVEKAGASVNPSSDFACYVKVCRNCAYVEQYSTFFVDQFEEQETQADSFGAIATMPDGTRLVSIFVEYQHRGVLARDFSIPIDSEKWFQLAILGTGGMSDDQLLSFVFDQAYQRAWRERVGSDLTRLAKPLRTLIQTTLDREAGSTKRKD